MHNPELKLASDFVQYTERNIFLTGKAGTGKTTFLHKLKETSPKRMVVVAPTGVAAINAGGVTIHSFFQMPFGPVLPERLNSKENQFIQKFNKKKINIIRSLDLLVIDEISMVRADLLDGIDNVLRRFKNKAKPFGGVQLLMIGDLQQLAPVVKEDEWKLLTNHYDTVFFFSSKAYKLSNAISIELKHIYRQQDVKFIKILNEIRNDQLSNETIEALNQRYIKGFNPDDKEGFISLTTHNASAKRINDDKLAKLKTKTHTFEADIFDLFPEYSFPTEQLLKLKIGAQVMFIKNDPSQEKKYFNGKIGKITEFEDDIIFVKCNDEEIIPVEMDIWENIKYNIDIQTKEIVEEVSGQFRQYPLKLAWAITIHKSQGLTFEKAVIDAQAAFAHGQTYVALSRCKTLEGLVLSSRIGENAIICDNTVSSFNRDVEENQPSEDILINSKQNFQLSLFEELFNFRQLQYHLDKCRKIVLDNPTIIQGNIGEKITNMIVNGSQILTNTGEKFHKQLRYIFSKEEPEKIIQERIKKASVYFSKNLAILLSAPFDEISYETDNKDVRKLIRERLQTISELLHVKKVCLETNKNGFDLVEYLNKRAVATLEKPKRAVRVKKPEAPQSTENPLLYENLRMWRKAIAEETGLPHYLIAHQKVLLAISNELPGNTSQLKAIKGIGSRKIKQYGEELISIVLDYCKENGVEVNDELIEEQPKTKKSNTKEISLEMYKTGKTVENIAKERNMTVGTIEGHFAHFVGTGELKLSEFIDDKKAETIITFFKANPNAGLNEAKKALGDSVTYGNLKLVGKHLEYLKNK